MFLKVDLSGNVLLSKTLATSDRDEPHRVLKCKNNSGFLVVGSCGGQHGNHAFVSKISNDGNVLWSYRYGGSEGEVLSDGVELENGNFIFTGTSFSYGNVSNDGDIWVLSTDSIGNILYSKSYGKYGTDRGKRIIEAKPNLFYITGETFSYGNKRSNAFALAINSTGDVANFETFGGDLFEYGNSIINNDNNSYTMGGYTNSFGFGGSNFFIVNKKFGPTDCYSDTFTILNNPTFPDRMPYLLADSTISIQANALTRESTGNFQTAEVCKSLTVRTLDYSNADLLLFPNPTIGIITFSSSNKNNPISEIHLYDMIGKEIVLDNQILQQNILNLESLSNAVYVAVVIMKDGTSLTRKIIKNNSY